MSVQVNLFKLALMTFVAVSLVVFGDTAGKLLTAQGVAPGLVAWSRFALAAMLLFPFVACAVARLLHQRWYIFNPHSAENRAHCKCIWCLFHRAHCLIRDRVFVYGRGRIAIKNIPVIGWVHRCFDGGSTWFRHVIGHFVRAVGGLLLRFLLGNDAFGGRGISSTAFAYLATYDRVHSSLARWDF